ncbi:hypothetical protein Pla144_46410 [Bythopirellula polymerisocia]|uniref:Uncharacterized protein n=1 Tax=Bythopirellula polymerisocia TaxID=2528003 RepID=A0A5C6CF36_9BACT|nr:hypothetical protein Pla144_46410 [Bythopirellula polymerisocia]
MASGKTNCATCGRVIVQPDISPDLQFNNFAFGPRYYHSCFKKAHKEWSDGKAKFEKVYEHTTETCYGCDGRGKIKGHQCQKCDGKGKTKKSSLSDMRWSFFLHFNGFDCDNG